MSANYVKSLMFWRKASKDISSLPPSFQPRKKSSLKPKVKLDFNQQSDLGVIPSYVQLDPDDPGVGHRPEAVSRFYESLLQEAPLLPAEFDTKLPPPPPAWMDKDRLTLGLTFVQAHLYSLFCAHLLSLFLIVTIRPLQALLLRTTPFHQTQGEDGAPSPSLLFTLKAVLKVRSIYDELRIWSSSGAHCKVGGGPEMAQLREWLKAAGGNFKKFLPPLSMELSLSSDETLEFLKLRQGVTAKCPVTPVQLRGVEKIRTTLNPVVPLSQYDLAILQFSFCALPTIFPKLFGLSSKNLQAFCHVWALIGHSLGLRDEFNFALLQSTQLQLRWRPIAEEVLEKIFKFSFTQLDSVGFKLWILLSQNLRREGFGWIFPVNLPGVVQFLSKSILDIRLESFGLTSRVEYWVHKVIVQASRCWLGRMMLNGMLKGILAFSTWFYIRRHAQERKGKNDLSASRMSLTRSIRWSSKEDGIAFDVV